MTSTRAYAAQTAKTPLAPFTIERREVGPDDVALDVLFCGVCHSDLHTARGEWKNVKFPSVPGHEIIGRVSKVGAKVTTHRVGDVVGVGCMVDSCRTCASCNEGFENYCDGPNGFCGTYDGWSKGEKTENTHGGYSAAMVVDQRFVLRIGHAAEKLAATAPLLCAGITLWSPLTHWKTGPGKKVGIVGIGGLGHMGIKLARALGATVVAFTSSEGKRQSALELGAHEVVVTKNAAALGTHERSFDLIIDTVSASHDLDVFTKLLKRDGTLVLVGVPEHPHPSPGVGSLIMNRRAIAGSVIGGIPETQQMLDFCAKHGITAEVEMIAMRDIEKAYERMLKSDVKYRFVIDMASINT